ncbi:MAG TPA: tetratricopeptide repeat protein [Gammaproteobacteria bacterium]|nr:tetratricopeptide repeat protein [Gammaproteobacteria bacterium]
MTRWAQGWLAIAVLAPAAHAAGPALTIELPDVELALPRVSPPHFQKEGLPYATENELVTGLLMLMGGQDYEAALTLAKKKHAAELALLDTGDPQGVVAGRAGPGRLPVPTTVAGDEISATVLYLIGVAYMELERYVPAEAALKAALVPLPDYLRVHEALGLTYLRMERFADARVHLARAAELGLNTAGLYALLGYVNSATKNYWGAASAYQQALTMDPANRNAQTGLLHALNETNQYAAGLALVEQMLQDDPNDPRLWLYRAHLSLSTDERESALTSLETAIRLGDDSVANRQVCATLHMERGSIARAVELLKGLPPEELEFQFMDQALAWLSYHDEWDYFRDLLGSVDQRRSTLTGLQRSRWLTRRSSLQLHDGDRPAAKASLQEAVELDASNAEALVTLGEAYRDDRDYSRAELMFERASVFDDRRENALVSLAQLAIDQQNFERALTVLRDVVSRNPARTDLQRNVDTLENIVLERTRN